MNTDPNPDPKSLDDPADAEDAAAGDIEDDFYGSYYDSFRDEGCHD